MARVLITGADGFVGRHLVSAARREGHEVVAAILSDGDAPDEWSGTDVRIVHFDLQDNQSVQRIAAIGCDWVIHLAAVASGREARRDPGAAWSVNTLGTARLAEALSVVDTPPRLLLVSTGEVYGGGHTGPIAESAPVEPRSPYAASKVAAEVAALEVWRRTGMDVVVARPFPHTGPGQSEAYVLPAFARRLRNAAQSGEESVPVGDLSPIRDFLDVRDVVSAYLALAEFGAAGECYNIASGTGQRLSDCFELLSGMTGSKAEARQDASLLRRADIPQLIGDATRLRVTTRWQPKISFTQTLQDLVNAQAD